MRGERAIRVIITAGPSGLGAAIADAFLGQGAQVHTCDIDQAAVERRRAEQSNLAMEALDVRDFDALRAWTERAVAAMGGCDVLINNAGVAGPVGLAEEISIDRWRDCMQINLDAQLVTCQAAIPTMKAQGIRSDPQHVFNLGPLWHPKPGGLHGQQVGRDWADQDFGD